jgi:hypothetical protein
VKSVIHAYMEYVIKCQGDSVETEGFVAQKANERERESSMKQNRNCTIRSKDRSFTTPRRSFDLKHECK